MPTFEIARRRYVVLGLLVTAGLFGWLGHHVWLLTSPEHRHSFAFLWFVTSAALTWHLVLSWVEPIYKVTDEQRWVLDKKLVTVNIPLYQEDPEIVRKVLESVLVQTRRPNHVEVVDDGSSVDYSELKAWWPTAAKTAGINGTWVTKMNGGKRSAQLTTFEMDKGADFFATMDSDVVLSPNALEEAMSPFADPKVTSVAAVCVAQNASENLLTRLTDLWFLVFQLCVRSALSTLKSVLVNSGSFAIYRADVVRDGIASYKAETFMKQDVQFSDDSLLTLFAKLKGKSVQQPTSVVATVLPSKVSHHLRQQLRWSRGSTIRSVWRFKYLPLRSWAFWEHAAAWMNFAIVATVFMYFLIWQPVVDRKIIPSLFAFTALVGYATALKYLTIRRSDVSFRWQLATYAMMPLVLVWSAVVLRPLRLYGIATCWKTGSWGTRKTVEVELAKAAL